jgi:hypothetical protein
MSWDHSGALGRRGPHRSTCSLGEKELDADLGTTREEFKVKKESCVDIQEEI